MSKRGKRSWGLKASHDLGPTGKSILRKITVPTAQAFNTLQKGLIFFGLGVCAFSMSRISKIELDDAALPPPTPEIEQERRVALYDLMEDSHFRIPAREDRPEPAGPFHVKLRVAERQVVFEVNSEYDRKVADFILSLSPFRQVIKDYWAICTSYFDAVRNMPPAQIETIDMARRGIHNEGARLLEERLEGKVELDLDTARRLFTLICVLHFKG